jgi:hypothetical protein
LGFFWFHAFLGDTQYSCIAFRGKFIFYGFHGPFVSKQLLHAEYCSFGAVIVVHALYEGSPLAVLALSTDIAKNRWSYFSIEDGTVEAKSTKDALKFISYDLI